MAAGLGTASGSVFALVPQVTPPAQVGAAGVVGAPDGLGGFVPPPVTGPVCCAEPAHATGFMLPTDLAPAGSDHAYGRMRNVRDHG